MLYWQMPENILYDDADNGTVCTDAELKRRRQKGMFDKWKRNKQETPAADAMRESNELTLEQAKQVTKGIIAQLGYPYQIFSLKASYEEVMKAYEQAVLQGQQEGFTPVLVRTDRTLEEHLGILKDDGYSVEDVLKSERKSGEELLKERCDEYIAGEKDEAGLEEFTGEFDGEPEVIDRYTAFQKWSDQGIVLWRYVY